MLHSVVRFIYRFRLLSLAATTLACFVASDFMHAETVSESFNFEQQPNILFLISDDQRRDTIGALGNQHIVTPSLDALARQGMYFEQAYCMGSTSGAVCGPSRAMLLSGRSLYRLGKNPFNLDDDIVVLPQLLRSAGYKTFATGKWHNGKQSFMRSFDSGGSIFFGGMGSHTKLQVHDFDPQGKYANDKRKQLHAFSSTQFANEAIEFLNSHDNQSPFFCYVSFTAPHDPRMPPEKFAEMYEVEELPLPANYLPVHPFDNGEMVIRDEKLAHWPRTESEVRDHIAAYYAMISQMDEQIGRIMEALKANGFAENTIVVFASDHGLAIGSHGLMGKQNLYEHSMGAPVIVSGPGLNAGERTDELIYLYDIMPTICELTGVPTSKGVDGISFAPVLRGDTFKGRQSIFTAYKQSQRAVRDKRWKLIQYPKINRTQLFDLQSDPLELLDLVAESASAQNVERLMRLLKEWQGRVGDDLPLVSDTLQSAEFDHVKAEEKRSG